MVPSTKTKNKGKVVLFCCAIVAAFQGQCRNPKHTKMDTKQNNTIIVLYVCMYRMYENENGKKVKWKQKVPFDHTAWGKYSLARVFASQNTKGGRFVVCWRRHSDTQKYENVYCLVGFDWFSLGFVLCVVWVNKQTNK